MLSYPIEMYYPDYDFGLPTLDKQALIIASYVNYTKQCLNQNEKIDLSNPTVQAMDYLLEKQKQASYFENVRETASFILSEIKSPQDLFVSMFPDKANLVGIFQQQFQDACELVSMDLDWERMNLHWSNKIC